MIFDESNDYHIEKTIDKENNLIEHELDKLSINKLNDQENETSNETPKDLYDPNLPKSWKYAHSHPKDIIIGDTS